MQHVERCSGLAPECVLQLDPGQWHCAGQQHPEPLIGGGRQRRAALADKGRLSDPAEHAVDAAMHSAAGHDGDVSGDKCRGLLKGPGNGVLTVMFQSGRHGQTFAGTCICEGHHSLDPQRGLGQRACLVEGNGGSAGCPFQKGAIADEHAVPAQGSRGNGDGDRCGQRQRARAGHYQHRQRNHPVIGGASQVPVDTRAD